MVPIQLGAMLLWNEAAPGQGNSSDGRRVLSQALFPASKVHSAGVRAQRNELCECDLGAFGGGSGGGEGLRTVAGQAEDERAQHMHAVTPKSSQALNQALSS